MELLILTLMFLTVSCEEKVNNTQNITLTKCSTHEKVSFTETLDENTNITTCDGNITDIKNRVITDIAKVCGPNKPCVTKCCGIDELLFAEKQDGVLVKHCLHIDKLKTILNVTDSILDYSSYTVMDKEIYKKGPLKTKKNLKKDFTVVVNKQVLNRDCGTPIKGVEYYLLEDGRFVVLEPHSYDMWKERKSSQYCIEKLVSCRLPHGRYYHFIKTVYDELEEDNNNYRNIFSGVAMLISTFFLLLVLLVYSVLKQLRNIHGMVVMAYVTTLAIGYLFRGGLFLGVANNTIDGNICNVLSPVCYVLMLSSFFWLNIMSFDIWWTFRGFRKVRRIHRQGELMKFMWYGVYAWGVPTILGIGAYCVDSVIDLKDFPGFITPHFKTCFHDHVETMLYLHTPILIMTVFNTLLSIMTIYNIWLINNNMAHFDNSKQSTNQNNRHRFCLYIKISALMGVSWIIELLNQITTSNYDNWLFILLNIYNMLIGVVIFFMFIFKFSIFKQLCQRFNINNRFTKRNVNPERSSEYTKSERSTKTKYFDTTPNLGESKTETAQSYLPE